MFDFNKLNDVSKNYISKLNKDQVYEKLTTWANVYDKNFYNIITKDGNYTKSVLNIDRENPKPRKDIAKWSEVKTKFDYMFDLFNPKSKKDYNLEDVDIEKFKEVCLSYIKVYNENDDKQIWFNKIKEMAQNLGYATDNKLYKQNPQNFKGNDSDVCMYIRIALTGKKDSPDLYSICQILKKQDVIDRLKKVEIV